MRQTRRVSIPKDIMNIDITVHIPNSIRIHSLNMKHNSCEFKNTYVLTENKAHPPAFPK